MDWKILAALRDRFLHPQPGGSDYWKTASELIEYDRSFARRIALKWRAVWTELAPALPSSMAVWDWGCGTGVATETLFEIGRLEKAWLSDRSARAAQFARTKLTELGVTAEILSENKPDGPYWLVASHVWNELSSSARDALVFAMENAEGFVWVEPGTPQMSQAVVALRERMRSRFSILGPCPHAAGCGVSGSDWCHFFAPPAAEHFTTAEWTRFAKELGVDLRSLPVSFLAMSRAPKVQSERVHGRVLGRPHVTKGLATGLVCRESGVVKERLSLKPGMKLKDFRETVFTRYEAAKRIP